MEFHSASSLFKCQQQLGLETQPSCPVGLRSFPGYTLARGWDQEQTWVLNPDRPPPMWDMGIAALLPLTKAPHFHPQRMWLLPSSPAHFAVILLTVGF